jgi:hypothetical protein
MLLSAMKSKLSNQATLLFDKKKNFFSKKYICQQPWKESSGTIINMVAYQQDFIDCHYGVVTHWQRAVELLPASPQQNRLVQTDAHTKPSPMLAPILQQEIVETEEVTQSVAFCGAVMPNVNLVTTLATLAMPAVAMIAHAANHDMFSPQVTQVNSKIVATNSSAANPADPLLNSYANQAVQSPLANPVVPVAHPTVEPVTEAPSIAPVTEKKCKIKY